MGTRISVRDVQMRKAPRQERAKDTVEAIIEAAARILSKRGWSGMNTNSVAEAAGVSIGSLYQYFPNKEALVEAIRCHHYDELLDVMHEAADHVDDETIAIRIRRLVKGIVGAHRISPELHRVLEEEVPIHASALATQDFETRKVSNLLSLLHDRNDLSDNRRRLIVLVAANAIEGVVHGAVREGYLDSPMLIDELTVLVQAYLASS